MYSGVEQKCKFHPRDVKCLDDWIQSVFVWLATEKQMLFYNLIPFVNERYKKELPARVEQQSQACLECIEIIEVEETSFERNVTFPAAKSINVRYLKVRAKTGLNPKYAKSDLNFVSFLKTKQKLTIDL